MDTLQDIEVQRAATLRKLREQTTEQLKIALDEAKIFDIDLDMQSPRILIPEDSTNENAPILVFDVGRLMFFSNSDASNSPANDITPSPKFYDYFLLTLSNTKAQLTTWNDINSNVNPI